MQELKFTADRKRRGTFFLYTLVGQFEWMPLVWSIHSKWNCWFSTSWSGIWLQSRLMISLSTSCPSWRSTHPPSRSSGNTPRPLWRSVLQVGQKATAILIHVHVFCLHVYCKYICLSYVCSQQRNKNGASLMLTVIVWLSLGIKTTCLQKDYGFGSNKYFDFVIMQLKWKAWICKYQ